jgi:hypothetical protein
MIISYAKETFDLLRKLTPNKQSVAINKRTSAMCAVISILRMRLSGNAIAAKQSKIPVTTCTVCVRTRLMPSNKMLKGNNGPAANNNICELMGNLKAFVNIVDARY